MLSLIRHSRVTLAWFALLFFGLQACSDEKVGGIIVMADAKIGFDAKPDTKKTDTQDIEEEEEIDESDVAVKRELIPMFDILNPVVVGPSANMTFVFKVIDYSVGGAAPNVPVYWEQTYNDGINGPGTGAMDSLNTFTDDKGVTGNVFHANKNPAVDYCFRVSAEGAESVDFCVSVTDTPKGNISVALKYDNGVAISAVTVRVVPAPFTCASFNPVFPTQNFLASKSTFMSDKPLFEALAADKKYGVYVIAKDVDNHLAAAGCADGVYVIDKQTTDITVDLKTMVYQASGTYDMINHFDFTGAIPGQLGQILDTAVQIFYDPGAFLIEQIKNLAKQFIGAGWLVDIVFSLFEDAVADVVTDWLLNSSPEWLQSFFGIGQDVLQIVKNLEMIGLLKIYKLTNETVVKGEINFTGVNLYWKLGCNKSDPNYDSCGKITLDAAQAVDDPNFPLDFLAGSFTGTISGQKKLDIDSSTIKLNYGKLILFVLTQVVLKAITGETTFSGAMKKMVNCKGIGDGIASVLGKGIGGQITNVCNGALDLLLLPLENLIGGLAIDSKLSLTGKCLMYDTDDDLKVDEMKDGIWVGNIIVDGAAGKNFKGDFSAIRVPGL